MIRMIIVWFEIDKETFRPDYDKVHTETVHGEKPYDCMVKFYEIADSIDLNKFTPARIAGIL